MLFLTELSSRMRFNPCSCFHVPPLPHTHLQLGYNTLITDMDLVYLKNPFEHLHRWVVESLVGHTITLSA